MIEPDDFLPIAEQMRSSPNEAERRTSVGRSYYALYTLVEQRLRPVVGPARQHENAHKRAHYYLKSSNNPVLRTVAQRLSSLRVDRNTADYDLGVSLPLNKSQQAYRLAVLGSTDLKALAIPLFQGAVQAVPTYKEERA